MSASAPAPVDGTVDVGGHQIWYQIVDDPSAPRGKLPVLTLHGGPGVPHDYLTDLARLAEHGRPVVFYDQLGCGRSDHPADETLWVMDTFVDELATIRRSLGLDRVHLLGHSWGGWLALDYALNQPDGVVSLVLASTCASIPAFAAVSRGLKQQLPLEVQRAIDHHEAAGTTDDDAYIEASMAYFTQWVCRRDPWPDHVLSSFLNLSEDVYGAMQGPEWNVVGNLKDWDVTDRLREIDLPVLVTSGRYDEMTPEVVKPLVEGIPGAEWVIFEDSAHLAMAEEPDKFRDVVESFLTRVENAVG